MLNNPFEDLAGHQEKLDEILSKMEITKKSPHDEVSVSVNAKKEILDITINKKFEDPGELEDLLVITLNDALKEADITAMKETNKLLNSMFPGGLSGLFGQ